ncbi:MAG: magnesium chelatase, partial [Candidatus Altarchaeaceae archaeon]
RTEIVKRRIEYEKDPYLFEKKWEAEQKKLADRIVKARELIDKVKYSDEILDLIAKICIEFGVDGHRADIFILKVAKAIAAYDLRTEVNEEDVKEAAELVLFHRMRKRPFEEPKMEKEKIEKMINKSIETKEHKNANSENKNQSENKPDAKNETVFDVGENLKSNDLVNIVKNF